MCPFCIATATLVAATGATSLGGVAALLTLKIRSDRRGKPGALEPPEQPSSALEEERYAS